MTTATAVIHLMSHAFIGPRIVGKWFHLHPVLALVILVVGEHFFGVWGLILGVPVAVYAFRVLISDVGVHDTSAPNLQSSPSPSP